MSAGQADFAGAVLDPDLAVPAGLCGPGDRPAGKRFDVYRNNVVHSLTGALADGFPVVRKLVGEDFFRAMAGVYVRSHPPRSPRLMLYGEGIPEFLRGFAPVAHLGYLADVARLELARRQSYHASDSAAMDAAALDGLDPEALLGLRFSMAPALRLVRSDWPVCAIWRANMEPGAPAPQPGAEDVLVARPGFDPQMAVLPAGGAAFVSALATGAALGDAIGAAVAEMPEFSPEVTLGLLLAGGALTGLLQDPSP